MRANCEKLDDLLNKEIKILDHGFIRVVDYMGNDQSIVQAARVSYGTGTKSVRADRGLIRYLLRHDHTTPFEMCDLKLHIKAPIFVARQWLRHRTASVNEYSARYSVLDNEFYCPDKENIACQSEVNKQGRDDTLMDNSKDILDILTSDAQNGYDNYQKMLDMGLTRELARMNVNLGVYTQFYWKINLHNLIHFLRLRADSHAQYEIRVYADAILHQIVKHWTPLTYEAFMDYKMNSHNLSGLELAAIKRIIKGEQLTQEDSGLSKREWKEFATTFNLAS